MRIFRFLLPLSLLILPQFIHGQFTDDFSDGDFTTDPAWSGDDALFVIVDDNGNNRLRSNSAGAATYHLSTPSTQATNAQWEFFIDLRFSTSGANYVDMYLISQQADLTPRPDGYFVRIGDTPDHIVLYRRQGGTNTALISSLDGTVGGSSANPFRIRVTRDPTDNWSLFYHAGETGTFTAAGTATDATFNTSTHFGILIVQSTAASAVNNHFFDNFSVGDLPADEDPPVLLGATVVDASTVDLIFDEPLAAATAQILANYSADNGLGQPGTVTMQSSSVVRLTFATEFTSGTTYTITVNAVEDLSGNAITNATASFLYFVPDTPLWREVVFNELMVDPTPSQGLPDSEYIELLNTTTDKFFDLGGWQITTNSSSATLSSYALAPGELVLLVTTSNSPLFQFVENRLAFSLSSTALTNSGNTLTLKDDEGADLDQLTYDLSWYVDPAKDDGGWSLELINPYSTCSSGGNWAASNAPNGGTPGEQNSVFDPTPDTTAPMLVSAFLVDSVTIELVFDEAMDAASLLAGNYSITPALDIVSIQATGSNARVRLVLEEWPGTGTEYTVMVTGVTDCPGNPIGGSNTVPLSIPEPASPGDIVINEVMYDPATGSSEFVELYNRSGKVIDLAGLYIARVPSDVSDHEQISSDAFLMTPGSFAVLTTNIADVAAYYPQSRTDRFVQMSLPSLTNSGGTISIIDSIAGVPPGEGRVLIDRFDYDPGMHFALVSNTKGFSLERVDPDRPTNDATNWQTASENAGMATPGFENSQYSPAPVATGTMTIDPAIFSPDNDGHQDVLTITYEFEQDGFVGTLLIFDVAGREVRRLMDNQLLGTSGSISWDGILDDGGKGRMGPYIVMMEAFDLEGNVERFKKTVTLAHYLD